MIPHSPEWNYLVVWNDEVHAFARKKNANSFYAEKEEIGTSDDYLRLYEAERR